MFISREQSERDSATAYRKHFLPLPTVPGGQLLGAALGQELAGLTYRTPTPRSGGDQHHPGLLQPSPLPCPSSSCSQSSARSRGRQPRAPEIFLLLCPVAEPGPASPPCLNFPAAALPPCTRGAFPLGSDGAAGALCWFSPAGTGQQIGEGAAGGGLGALRSVPLPPPRHDGGGAGHRAGHRHPGPDRGQGGHPLHPEPRLRQ